MFPMINQLKAVDLCVENLMAPMLLLACQEPRTFMASPAVFAKQLNL